MNIVATILILLFLPFNYFFVGTFGAKKEAVVQKESEKTAEEKSPPAENFKGSIAEEGRPDEGFGGSGYLPQRQKNYYDLKIFAGSSVVIDVDSGTILHYDEGRKQTPIASLTKMMTATVVMGKVKDLNEPVTIDNEALHADGTKVGCPTSVYCNDERLHLGEQVTVKDLLMAMLLDSANDAAIALGKHVAGSQKGFADLMNEKAQELNLSDSHFCNPSGLDEDGCYSSAYDLARIAAYSMRYDLIWKIMKSSEQEIGSCDGKYSHLLRNTDLLLGQIPNCLGGKTGFTYNAGKSLMLAAADPVTGKHKIIAVILNDNNRWEDMTKLVNWTFDNYDWK